MIYVRLLRSSEVSGLVSLETFAEMSVAQMAGILWKASDFLASTQFVLSLLH